MTIPLADLTVSPVLRTEIETGFREVLDSGRFVLGPRVEAFESRAAAYLGCRHAVSCGSGSDALRLALLAAGVGPGDEVITTAFSFFATVEAICQTGASPVFVDIDRDTFNLDVRRVRAAVTRRTRAIVPVHLFGQAADMPTLQEVAAHARVPIIEDCAQAFGARHGERKTGTFGLAGCFSFYPSKNLGACGDGGLICTDSDTLADQLRALRNHGAARRNLHRTVGCNSRLDELQAVVLLAKLPHIDRDNAERRRVACGYDEKLAVLPGISVPREAPGGYHVYHQYTILADRRDAVMAQLRRADIDCAAFYPTPLYRQPALPPRYRSLHLAAVEYVARHCLSLPMYPALKDEQVRRVAAAIAEAVHR